MMVKNKNNNYSTMETKDDINTDSEGGLYSHIIEEEEDSKNNIFMIADGHGSHKGTPESSYSSASLHIINTTMGAGVLSIPVVFRYLGIVLGTLFIFFIGATTIFSVYILLKCREISGKNGYAMFAKITYGAAGSLFVKIIIIINNLGLCIAYFIIFGTTCKNLASVFFDQDSYLVTNYHNYIFVLFIFLIMFLLIFKENLDSLKSASFLGVTGISIFFICLVIIFFYKLANGEIEEPTREMLWPSGETLDIIGCLPTVFLAFTFQFNLFPIFFTLKKRTSSEMIKATVIAVSFCTVIYSITGVIGYIMYRDELKDTILQALTSDVQQYKGKDNFLIVLLVLINIGFLFSSTMSIPLMFFSLKNNFVNSIIFCKKKFFSSELDQLEILNKSDEEIKDNLKVKVVNDIATDLEREQKKQASISQIAKYVIITILYTFICFVAIVIPELKVV